MVIFAEEAEEAINAYLKKVDKKIDELGFEISGEYRKDFLLAVYHSLKLSAILHAKRKARNIVGVEDAKASFRFLSPKMLIRHGLRSPQNFRHLEKLRERHFRTITEKASSCKVFRVLDAGCGWGRQLMEFLRRGWTGEFFGVDIDLEAIKYGKSVEPQITFIKADIQGNLPFKDNFFDAIICVGVLHFTDADKTIQEFARILKPNGLLFFTQSFAENKLIGNLAYLTWRLLPKIGRLYQVADIEKILSQHGFAVMFMDKASPLPWMLGSIYICTAFLSKVK